MNQIKTIGQDTKNLLKKIKDILLKENNSKCDKCKKVFSSVFLEIDHKIPIKAGGKIFAIENCQILCRDCHRKKTKEDIKILSCMKKLNLMKTSKNKIETPFSRKELIITFRSFKNKKREAEKRIKDGKL